MSDSENNNDKPVNLRGISIEQQCLEMAQDYLPQVKRAVGWLLDNDPYKGILAWERIAEFSVAKKSKQNDLPPNTNITINMLPATREDAEYVDITNQKNLKDLGEETDFTE